MAYNEPQLKRFRHSIISEHMYDVTFDELFANHWQNYLAVKKDNLEIITSPFRVCKISNFVKSDEVMEEIKSELLYVRCKRNSIDLYQFEQSNDLSSADSKYLTTLFGTFQTDMVNWMERNTKIDLNKKISMSSCSYSDTDFLLCHDDNLGDRRIAFILYLSEDWTPADGGSLDLFDTDENGLPRNIVKSLVPEYNSLVFFEVTDDSYHQVAEVVSLDKCRWTISGWFHGPLIPKEKPPRPILDADSIDPENTKYDLEQWIRAVYLSPEIIKEINMKIEAESCAFLSEFLLTDVYEKLSQEILNEDIRWKKVGPADQKNYEIAEEESLPDKLKAFFKLFKSLTIFTMLKNLTELDLVPERDDMKPKVRIELQRWTVGCYTLISDNQIHGTTTSRTERKSVINSESMDEDQGEGNQYLLYRPKLFPATMPRGKCLGDAYQTPPSSDDETPYEIMKRVINDQNTKAQSNSNIYQLSVSDRKNSSSSVKISSDTNIADSNANMSSSDGKKSFSSANTSLSRNQGDGSDSGEADTEDVEDDEIRLRILNRKTKVSRKNLPLSEFEMSRGTDSEESDIEDYLSDPKEHEDEEKLEEEQEDEEAVSGSLDVIIQFHTHNASENSSIDYVYPREETTLIHVPPKDNYLCLAFKTHDTCRVHRYVNHYCKGFYYNMISTYYE